MPNLIPLGTFTIEYLDGEKEEVRSNFGSVMELETELPDPNTPDGTALLYGIWLYKDRPDGDPITWGKKVHNITPSDAPGAADPSRPEAGAG
jgi:hypothetical protein